MTNRALKLYELNDYRVEIVKLRFIDNAIRTESVDILCPKTVVELCAAHEDVLRRQLATTIESKVHNAYHTWLTSIASTRTIAHNIKFASDGYYIPADSDFFEVRNNPGVAVPVSAVYPAALLPADLGRIPIENDEAMFNLMRFLDGIGFPREEFERTLSLLDLLPPGGDPWRWYDDRCLLEIV